MSTIKESDALPSHQQALVRWLAGTGIEMSSRTKARWGSRLRKCQVTDKHYKRGRGSLAL